MYAAQDLGQVLDRGAKVCELLDLETNWWNTELVQSVFHEDKAKEICGIAVCPQTCNDKLVWPGAKNGAFTVCNAYHIAKEQGMNAEQSYSNPQMIELLWKDIWNVKGSRVVKTFL